MSQLSELSSSINFYVREGFKNPSHRNNCLTLICASRGGDIFERLCKINHFCCSNHFKLTSNSRKRRKMKYCSVCIAAAVRMKMVQKWCKLQHQGQGLSKSRARAGVNCIANCKIAMKDCSVCIAAAERMKWYKGRGLQQQMGQGLQQGHGQWQGRG